MSRILALANVKGGVGKTTATVNLAAALVERGRKVLTVDLDPQASLTTLLGLEPDQLSRTIREALDASATPVVSILVRTREGIDLVPANHELESTSHELANTKGGISAIRVALEPLRDRYDYMLLDCPANAGILTAAALAAADEVIIPVTLDYVGFRSLSWLISLISQTRETANPNLKVAGIFYSMADFRTRHARQIISQLKAAYGSGIPFFFTAIQQSVYIKDAAAVGKTILHHAPVSVASESYRALAEEIDAGIRKSADNELYFILADAQEAMARKDASSAYAAYCRATEIKPELTEAWIGRAASASEWSEAVRCYARALKLESLLHPARVGLEGILNEKTLSATHSDIPELLTSAHYLEEIGQTSYAEKLYAVASELDPMHEEAWLGRARTAKNAKEAVSYVERCLKIRAANPQAEAAMASAKERLKSEAISLIEDGSKLEREGKRNEAHSVYMQAVELDPSNELGWLGCAHTTDDFGALRRFSGKVLEINPQNKEALETFNLLRLWTPGTGVSQSVEQPGVFSWKRLIIVSLVLIGVVVALFVILRL